MGRKSISASSRLKSAVGGRMVLAATCQAAPPSETGRRGSRLSPRVPHAEARGACCSLQLVCVAGQELKEIGYGEQQAGAEHPRFLSEHGPQRATERHHLSAQRSEVNGPHSFLRQVFRSAGGQRTGAINLQTCHLNRGNRPYRLACNALGALGGKSSIRARGRDTDSGFGGECFGHRRVRLFRFAQFSSQEDPQSCAGSWTCALR